MQLAHFAIMCAVFLLHLQPFPFFCLFSFYWFPECLPLPIIHRDDCFLGVGGFTVMVPNVLGCKDRHFCINLQCLWRKNRTKKVGAATLYFFFTVPDSRLCVSEMLS